MLHASRNNEELALSQRDDTIAELHVEASVDDEEELILALVLMPHELALEFDELYMLTVEFTDDLRIPMCVEQRELFAEIDLLHETSFGTGGGFANFATDLPVVAERIKYSTKSPAMILGDRNHLLRASGDGPPADGIRIFHDQQHPH